MAELNLKQIEDKLNEEFKSDARKLIFWYDENADFAEDVDSLELKNAKLLRLEKDNLFYTKYYLECEDITTNYLLYAPFPKPSLRENPLADTLLYSKEFFADRASMLMSDLGIDEKYKDLIKKYNNFFANKERTRKFYDLQIDSYDKTTIEIGLMSVICKNNISSFEEVVRCVLTDDDFEDNKYLLEFEKYGLLEAFWEYADSTFGFNNPNPTLEKLAILLLVTYASKAIHSDLPPSWQGFVSYKVGNVMTFVDNLMHNSLYSEKFDEISENIYRKMGDNNYFSNLDIEDIMDCSLFASIDEIIVSKLVTMLENENVGIKFNNRSIPDICDMRIKKHFGPKFRNQYNAIKNAFYIISEAKYQPITGIDNIVDYYLKTAYKTDTAYRYFYYSYERIENTEPFEKLSNLVENIYTNDFLNPIISNWTKEFKSANAETKLPLQRQFYRNNVANAKDRTVVIISDAFRYEVAYSLFEKLMTDEKCDASIEAMQGVLPSYTALGMSALLPYKNLELNDKMEVTVDGKVCSSTQQRETQLKAYKSNSACVRFDSVKNMKTAELRKIFTGQDIIYVYHNQVDARGDAAKTENEVFTACEEAVEEIHAFIRKVSSQANTHHFLITADHGFIYKRDSINLSDKIEGLNTNPDNIHHRYIITDIPINADGVCNVALSQILRNDNKRFVSFPLASDIFKAGGSGQNYVHGGCSPQEMLIPLIDVKVYKGKKETTTASINLVSNINKVTNLILNLDFMQKEPVSDVVKETTYRIYFISDSNEKISNENIYVADKKDQDVTKRMFRLNFNFKNKKYDKSHKYYLVAYDTNNDIEALRYEFVIDIPFADNFGFFA